MLSLQQAIEIKESIRSYLHATFTFRKKEVAHAFDQFIDDPERGMFKGPYVSLKLRFVKADQEMIDKIPLTIKPNWPPFDHQVIAWTKLSTQNKKPEPTIVTTGTGSGKTESFLFPMLDYCYQQQHRPGVKVIILYPMNALATDQATRLAEMIYEDERLRGKVRAGLFIGEGNGKKGEFPKIMGEKNIIEHRDTILDTAPDIILTNFKMLDYALMKHNYHKLWSHNFNDTSLLQFLVLDELHTYDGAQGTDVANLIRRLKLKLNIPAGQLCPVGTSATIGSGEDAPNLLADYATKVFGEVITSDAVITENRISIDEFFGENDALNDFIPLPNKLKELAFTSEDDFSSYIKNHINVWQQDEVNLTQGLLQLKIVKDLVLAANRGNSNKNLTELINELNLVNPSFRKLADWDEENSYSPKLRVIESLLALISQAKDLDNKNSPLMYIQIQLWIRELSGLQYTLEKNAKFSFRDHVDANDKTGALPPWYCRECNSSGWLGVKPENKDVFSKDINEIYEKFFNHHKNLYFILPKGEMSLTDFQLIGYNPTDRLELKIDPISLHIMDHSEKKGLEIQALRKVVENKTEHICPCCNSSNTVSIIGTKIPTLSSIAVSQSLATDLDKEKEKDRKVLAFTNSVQDAAHQAGFIEGRNYRFTLRASIQKVINEFDENLNLVQLADRFIEYWKENADETGQDKLGGYFYRFFPKDYIGKASPKDYKAGNTYADHFIKEFDHRMRWEIISEFGYNAKIGRTLEKTGASSVFFDENKILESWKLMSNWVQENDISRTITKEDFLKFTNLILHRTRTRGGVDHLYLNKYRTNNLSIWDLNWQRDTRHFLNPNFGTRTRFPKLLTNAGSKENLLDTTFAKNTNWFHTYFQKTFVLTSVTTDFINEFYSKWLEVLVETGILDCKKAGDYISYAINPNNIFIKNEVKVFKCNTCENPIYTFDEEYLTVGAKCLDYRCTGVFEEANLIHRNYYQTVYNRNRFPRIYANEHTGLLDRKVREQLEKDFKKREKFNSTNTLLATSTLEMGIDIGSLNTAYNNSIPPLPSNFVQRVGRAGRSSGSALIVNFAKNQNHDLYYYADPLEMIQGEVNTPGCYLEAKDILKRHFIAYCIDSWTTANPNENVIPSFVRDLKLSNSVLTSESFFINRLNHFIDQNKLVLKTNFLKQYIAENIEANFKEINDALHNRSFYDYLLNAFYYLINNLNHLDAHKENIKAEIEILKLVKGDPLYEEYLKEIKNSNGLKKSILATNVLEYLTNIGILPNYAFPETGVKLNAHVIANKAEEALEKDINKEFEIIRPASQAIRELAPENTFYSQGYEFKISGVNTFDWSDRAVFHSKRFCSKCDHIAIDLDSKKGNCPKCGDVSWSSNANVHQFAKLTQVKSYVNKVNATLSDKSDDRDQLIYQVLNHVVVEQNSSAGAWVLKQVPFGIEFVKNATITSVNYGALDDNDARKLKINDQEVLAKGFVTCKQCGKSTATVYNKNNASDFHYGYCKNRDIRYKPEETTDVFEEVYFFREIKTELLKIILPIQSFNTNSDIQMFQAGLELGLKKYFKGNPNHIRIMIYREYNQNTEKFDRFLLLYDTIPGGTGYLEKLFDPNEFALLIQNSYDAIKSCSCQLEGHDGCYKCIYSYSNQYNRSDLSRERAEKWFHKIYSISADWVKNENGLTSLTTSGKIEESELEERFIQLLQIYSDKNEGFELNSHKIDGTINYQLSIEKDDVKANYWIRPQINLGPKDGIEYSTRTDFLIECTSFNYRGIDYENQVPNVAIYLDGYQYHASEEHNIFERDLKIRQAIAKHPDFITWSLTWADLDLFENQLEQLKNSTDEIAQLFKAKYSNHYREKLVKSNLVDTKVFYDKGSNNVDRLLLQLIQPQIQVFQASWIAFLSSWTSNLFDPSFDPNKLEDVLNEDLTVGNFVKESRSFDALIPVQHSFVLDFVSYRIWTNFLKREILVDLSVKNLNKIDKVQWNQFLALFNLFQRGIDAKNRILIQPTVSDNEAIFIDQLFELYDEKFHSFLSNAVNKGFIYKDNYEFLENLLDDKGNVIADALIIIKEIRIAIAPYSEESNQILNSLGYEIYSEDQINTIQL